LSNLPLGLLLNFNVTQLKDGVSRMIGAAAVVPRVSR
jgi:hypothetical protein